LSQAQIEPPQQRRDHAGLQLPAAKRTLRHAAVDQDHRHAPIGAVQYQVGPQIGFDEQSEIGLPMFQEASHKSRSVDRNKLVDDAGRKALFGQRGGSNRTRGNEHGKIPDPDPFD
jgi:hypothetical protein